MTAPPYFVPRLAELPADHHQVAVDLACEFAYDRGVRAALDHDLWLRECAQLVNEAWAVARLHRLQDAQKAESSSIRRAHRRGLPS